MAVNNTAKKYSDMEFPLAMKRQDAFALDETAVWPSMETAQAYAKTNPTAYIGQLLSVIVDGAATPYVIQNAAGDLAPLGAAAVTIASDAEANEALHSFAQNNDLVRIFRSIFFALVDKLRTKS